MEPKDQKDLYLTHIHNPENDVYIINESLWGAISSVVNYVDEWWAQEMPGDKPDPIGEPECNEYFEQTGEWGNIVHLVPYGMSTEVINPGRAWRVWNSHSETV